MARETLGLDDTQSSAWPPGSRPPSHECGTTVAGVLRSPRQRPQLVQQHPRLADDPARRAARLLHE